ncbi:type IV secretory system conjugative DNA transfer family protein [Niabella hibiscisoli]|uniref:type IV secretory system conjugative DNA transfer family protein n=1 Tax=Niabella hibiscisoli TaxID=1825928 RepID=UPI001F113C6E|nr:TraG/TraD/VirD4 family protein [Niabella hibiscisoli]MCH5716709.1 TraG/TraD/VirD4 family protein [Niabella hibiscisoli]
MRKRIFKKHCASKIAGIFQLRYKEYHQRQDNAVCHYPPDKLDSHYQYLRLVMTTALRSAVRNHDKRITFLLDEFAALGYLPEMKTALSTYAGYNITMWPIVQDLGQLKSIYGEVWETFISNTAVRNFLSVSDVFSLEYLSKLMGTKTVVTYDEKGKPNTTSRPLATQMKSAGQVQNRYLQ